MCSPSIPILAGEAPRLLFRCVDNRFADSHAAAAASGPLRAITISPLHLGSRLPGIAPIGKEHPILSCDHENACAAGESAEIANIRRMDDQQRVQAMVGKKTCRRC